MINKFLSTLLFLAGFPCAVAVTAQSSGTYSYYLPKTAVRMALLIEKTSYEPGQLANYSELYMKTSARPNPETSYRIVGVSFSTYAVPDSAKRFGLTIDRKHSVISLECDENGVLQAINAKPQTLVKPQPFRSAPKAEPLSPTDYMSQDILSAENKAKMARLVAQEIYDIRDSRNQLVRGEADFMPKDGEQLKIMLSQLSNQEAALLQVFQGEETRDTTEAVVTFVPEAQTAPRLLFRFSRHFGLTTADDLSGEPYFLQVEDLHVLPEPPLTPDDVKKIKDESPIHINLPGKMRVSILNRNKPIATQELVAAQFGRVEPLNGALFGKKFTSRLVLNPTTGGVVSLQTEPLE